MLCVDRLLKFGILRGICLVERRSNHRNSVSAIIDDAGQRSRINALRKTADDGYASSRQRTR